MLALSVKQPWAELIARGTKKKEYRSWSRSCFGDLLIVASKSVDDDAMDEEGLDPASLVLGRAVCVVEFYKVTGDEDDYAWHLRNPRRVEPVEIRGSASLYHVPDEHIRFVGGARAEAAPAKPRKTVRVPPKRVSKAVRVPPMSALEYAPPKRALKTRRVPPKKDAASKRARVDAAVTREPEEQPPPKCSACGASDVIPILYGYPGPQMGEQAERGEIELGGCCISGLGDDPAWRCRACGEAFGVLEVSEFDERP
jgi:hypothetical protein